MWFFFCLHLTISNHVTARNRCNLVFQQMYLGYSHSREWKTKWVSFTFTTEPLNAPRPPQKKTSDATDKPRNSARAHLWIFSLGWLDQRVNLPASVCKYALELITGEYCHLLALIDSVIILWSKTNAEANPPQGIDSRVAILSQLDSSISSPAASTIYVVNHKTR